MIRLRYLILVSVPDNLLLWTMSDMVKYRAAIWSFLKLMALYFTMSDIVHQLTSTSLKQFLNVFNYYSAGGKIAAVRSTYTAISHISDNFYSLGE